MSRNFKGLYTSDRDDWETPQDLFDKYDAIHHFTLDAASSDHNAKCRNHYTIADDGLAQNWGGQKVWLNPPYGRKIGEWIRKAYEESRKPDTVVVCLLPARTDTAWFHDYCMHGSVEFIRGRIRFSGSRASAPFPSMIVVFSNQ